MMVRHDADPTACVHGGYHSPDQECASQLDPLAALIVDIARTGWRNLCWLVRTTCRNLHDNR